jgi:hypothetical protein
MFPKDKYNASLKTDECMTNIPQLNTHVTTQNHFRNVIDTDIVLRAGFSKEIFGTKRQDVENGGNNLSN